MKNVCLLETLGTLYMAPATVTELLLFFKATWAGKEEGGHRTQGSYSLSLLNPGFSETPWNQVRHTDNPSFSSGASCPAVEMLGRGS